MKSNSSPKDEDDAMQDGGEEGDSLEVHAPATQGRGGALTTDMDQGDREKMNRKRRRASGNGGGPLTFDMVANEISSQEEEQMEEQEEEQQEVEDSSESQKFWPAKAIINERKKHYLLEWEGTDPATGKPWEPTWEPKENANESLRREWERKKSGGASKNKNKNKIVEKNTHKTVKRRRREDAERNSGDHGASERVKVDAKGKGKALAVCQTDSDSDNEDHPKITSSNRKSTTHFARTSTSSSNKNNYKRKTVTWQRRSSEVPLSSESGIVVRGNSSVKRRKREAVPDDEEEEDDVDAEEGKDNEPFGSGETLEVPDSQVPVPPTVISHPLATTSAPSSSNAPFASSSSITQPAPGAVGAARGAEFRRAMGMMTDGDGEDSSEDEDEDEQIASALQTQGAVTALHPVHSQLEDQQQMEKVNVEEGEEESQEPSTQSLSISSVDNSSLSVPAPSQARPHPLPSQITIDSSSSQSQSQFQASAACSSSRPHPIRAPAGRPLGPVPIPSASAFRKAEVPECSQDPIQDSSPPHRQQQQRQRFTQVQQAQRTKKTELEVVPASSSGSGARLSNQSQSQSQSENSNNSQRSNSSTGSIKVIIACSPAGPNVGRGGRRLPLELDNDDSSEDDEHEGARGKRALSDVSLSHFNSRSQSSQTSQPAWMYVQSSQGSQVPVGTQPPLIKRPFVARGPFAAPVAAASVAVGGANGGGGFAFNFNPDDYEEEGDDDYGEQDEGGRNAGFGFGDGWFDRDPAEGLFVEYGEDGFGGGAGGGGLDAGLLIGELATLGGKVVDSDAAGHESGGAETGAGSGGPPVSNGLSTGVYHAPSTEASNGGGSYGDGASDQVENGATSHGSGAVGDAGGGGWQGAGGASHHGNGHATAVAGNKRDHSTALDADLNSQGGEEAQDGTNASKKPRLPAPLDTVAAGAASGLLAAPNTASSTVPSPLSPALSRVLQAEDPFATAVGNQAGTAPRARSPSPGVSASASAPASGIPGSPTMRPSAMSSRNVSPAPGVQKDPSVLIELIKNSTLLEPNDGTKTELVKYVQNPAAYISTGEGSLSGRQLWAFGLRPAPQEKMDIIIINSAEGTYQLKRVQNTKLPSLDLAKSISHVSRPPVPSPAPVPVTAPQPVVQPQVVATPAPAPVPRPIAPAPAPAPVAVSTPGPTIVELIPTVPVVSMSRESLEQEVEALRAKVRQQEAELAQIRPLSAETAKLRTDVANLTKTVKSVQASKDSINADLGYFQKQYTDASNAAVARANETRAAEAEAARLKRVVDVGLAQRELFQKSEVKKVKDENTRLQSQMKLYLAESRRTEEMGIRTKAALWDKHLAELRDHAVKDEEEDDDDDEEADVSGPTDVSTQAGVDEVYQCAWRDTPSQGCDAVLPTRKALLEHAVQAHVPASSTDELESSA
ncbi:hypothetical protein T439DRAFT_349386 [Meredithblackwellia eburnea MCA 4105]